MESGASSSLVLAPCRLDSGLSAQCGTFDVFENRKDGRKLSLSVAVLPALSSSPLPDPLVVLAGGPGQAASDVAPTLAVALSKLRRDRDIVVLDQRGTGQSHPLRCEFDEPDSSLAKRLRTELDEAKLADCVATLGADADLRYYGTEIAIDDLEDVRAALGYPRVNLWGGSYGTRVALAYLRKYPDRVRSAVLDGVAPLSLVLPVHAPRDMHRALQLLFAQCRDDVRCAAQWPEIETAFGTVLDSLANAPHATIVPDPLTGAFSEVTITRDAFARVIGGLLYQAEATSLIPLTIARAAEGDFRPFVGQAEYLRTSSNGLVSNGLYYSVVCTEDRPLFDERSLAEAAAGTFLGPTHADELLRVCERWPQGNVSAGFRAPVTSDVPVLLLSGELDPVTPPRWADEASRTLSRSLHVIISGTGHGTLGNRCARHLVEAFIAAGTVDGLQSECAQESRPPFFLSSAGPAP